MLRRHVRVATPLSCAVSSTAIPGPIRSPGSQGSQASARAGIPVHKTGTAFTKPVDPLLGQAIEAWQAVRPDQPKMLDPKTGERADFVLAILLERLADVPTPAGPTPRQLAIPARQQDSQSLTSSDQAPGLDKHALIPHHDRAGSLKCLYLAITSLDPTGKGRQRWTNRWKAALNAFDITFDGRLSAGPKAGRGFADHAQLPPPYSPVQVQLQLNGSSISRRSSNRLSLVSSISTT